ncbi:MAG TPA: ABC transporter ATP-binding protein [Kofleriaceae bacterium]|nr:ABC transporter ATP-binding protein [Kofleriaceae bacterium]
MPLLEMDNVTAGYGASIVLDRVSLAIAEGDALAVLGRNGVGKTTLLTTLMGLTTLRGGTLRWQGRDLGGLSTYRRARAGLGWVPQERLVYRSLTVHEHLTAVARPGAWTSPRIYALFPSLERRRRSLGDQLSGGEQQMLAIARALVTNPRLLLLDEPLEGLAPIMAHELVRVIHTLRKDAGMAIIVVEQHARIALSLTEHAIALDRGKIVYRGDSQKLAGDPDTLHHLLVGDPRTDPVEP